jgi:Flp pilus assembly protein TadG
MARWRSEEGSVTVFVVGLTLALMMVAGLVYDGGRILAARRQAHDLADNAARAAAQAVDLDALRSGTPVALDPLDAQVAAEDYLATTGHTGEVAVTADAVEVTVTITTPMVLLQLAGIAERTVTASGEARLVRGITGPEA